MKKFVLTVPLFLLLGLGSRALLAREEAAVPVDDTVSVAEEWPAISTMAQLVLVQELELAAASWTFVGCIQLNQTCYDVYDDGTGALWVCKACGTTKSPGPGKCRRLTAYEIANSLWCS